MTLLEDATNELIKILNYSKTDDIESYKNEVKESVKKFAQMIKQIT